MCDRLARMQLLSINETFAGRRVLITGGTGFVGRVLIEKLLRSCPSIERIYVLMRAKRGKSVEERLHEISRLLMFEKLRLLRPDDFKDKVVAISSDIYELNLGMSQDDFDMLRDEVDVVYHVAATVKFNQPLKDAMLTNIRGTREVCNLALTMKKLECFVHVSTCYAFTKFQSVDEVLYPATTDWRKCIEVAENCDRHTLQIIMLKYMEGYPNSYTFTKSLAEHVVTDLLSEKIACLIIRPSIVAPAYEEPLRGWIDNFNGPWTFFLLSGLGLSRIGYMNNIRMDFIPVDMCIKLLIIAVWKQLKDRNNNVLSPHVKVYNCSSLDGVNFKQSEIIHFLNTKGRRFLSANTVWYPHFAQTSNYYYYYITFMIFQLIPSLIGDLFLKSFTGKTRFFKIQRSLFTFTDFLSHFSLNEWNFANDNVMDANNEILPSDQGDFSIYTFDWRESVIRNINGFKKYLLHEKQFTYIDAIRIKLLFALHWILVFIGYYILCRFTYYKINEYL